MYLLTSVRCDRFVTNMTTAWAAGRSADSVSRQNFPMDDCQWMVVGSAGSGSLAHFDGKGFATSVRVDEGQKLWLIGVPHQGKPDSCPQFYARRNKWDSERGLFERVEWHGGE